jgi:hypothetical protein
MRLNQSVILQLYWRTEAQLHRVHACHYRNRALCRVPEHSAKPKKHSAYSLSSVTLKKESSVNSTSATTSLPSTFYRALDKDFAFVECQSVLDKEKQPSRRLVTETAPLLSALGDTRQRN